MAKLFYVFLLASCHFTYVYSGSLNFFVLGDWGGIPTPPFSTKIERGVSRSLMNLGNKFTIDFLLALGDNFYYDGVENEFDSRFNTSFETVFKASDLFFPWYFIAGNHDWRGNVSAQIAYTSRSTRWRFPDYFYTIERSLTDDPDKRIAIIMIDTVLLCGLHESDFKDVDVFQPIASLQQINTYWKFIKRELVRVRRYAYIIVAGHYPIWSIAAHGPTKCLVDKLDPLIKQFNVSAYMNGHEHTVEHIRVPYGDQQAMDYLTIGAGNFFSNSKKHKHSVNPDYVKFHWDNVDALGAFAMVSATTDSLKVNIISTERDSIYQTEIFPRQ